MSNRSNVTNVDQGGACRRRARSCAWGLAILIATWTGAPGVGRADAVVLTNGEVIEGSIVDATRNTVVVRRAIGGMRQMPSQDIAEIRVLVQGETIVGQLLGWVDGVHQIDTGGEILRIGAGRIISRDRPEQATTQPQRSPSAQILPQQPPPGLVERPTVETAAPASTPPDVPPAEVQPVEVKRAQSAAAKASPITRSAARVARTKAPMAEVATPVDGGGEDGIGEVAASEARAAAAAIAEVTPSLVAIARAAAAEVDAARPATAPVSPAEAAADEAAMPKIAATPEAERDGEPVVVTASVDPAEADGAGIIFRIELSRPAEQAVVLIYGTVDGTAVAGRDYEPQQGVVTLAHGMKKADIHVPLIGHRRPRGDGRFELFVTADPKVATVMHQRVSATIPAAH